MPTTIQIDHARFIIFETPSGKMVLCARRPGGLSCFLQRADGAVEVMSGEWISKNCLRMWETFDAMDRIMARHGKDHEVYGR